MPIPSVDPGTGLLPAAEGPYVATLAEIESVFVDAAPNAGHRAEIFAALCTWIYLARRTFGNGRAWIDGGFVTHKLAEPHDVDVVFIPDDVDRTITALHADEGWPLLTIQDMFFASPDAGGWLARLQCVGGLVDGFLVDPRDAVRLGYWHRLWSSVKGPEGDVIPGVSKGYLEVVI